MDPMTGMAMAAPIIGGFAGANAADAGMREAQRQQQAALAQFLGLRAPTVEEQKVQFDLPEYFGGFTAQTEGNIGMGPSAMEGVSTDPRLQEAQMAALQQIAEIGQAGMTPAEAAALRTARRGAAAEAQAKSNQVLQEMQRRGMGGSGMELAARLQAAQSGADRMSQESDRAMQMAQQRALQAISQSGSMAGQMRGQQFGEQSDIARARDAINQFNTQNQQQVQARNTAATNQAALRNLSEQQRIGEARSGIRNQEQVHNKGLLQNQFQNQMSLASARAGQYNAAANLAGQAGANKGQMYANIGSAVGKGAMGMANNNAADDAYMKGAWDAME